MSIGAGIVVYGDARIVSADTVEVGGTLLHAAKRMIIASGSRPARLRVSEAELAITSDEFLRLDRTSFGTRGNRRWSDRYGVRMHSPCFRLQGDGGGILSGDTSRP